MVSACRKTQLEMPETCYYISPNRNQDVHEIALLLGDAQLGKFRAVAIALLRNQRSKI